MKRYEEMQMVRFVPNKSNYSLYQKRSVALKYAEMRWRLDPAGKAYDAPLDPLVGWRGGQPLPIPYPLRRLRRLDPRAY